MICIVSLLRLAAAFIALHFLVEECFAAAAASDHPGDRAALGDIYRTTGGPYWLKSDGWLVSNVSMCAWRGITCFSNTTMYPLMCASNNTALISPRRVCILNFRANNNVSGFVTDRIGALSEIRAISIISNRGLASSTIPAAIGNLNALIELGIQNCGLIGHIPNTIGNCRSLVSLDFSGNHLASTLPPELGNAASLRHLSADGNRLSGTIPNTYQNLVALETMHLDNNQLELPLPYFGNMINLDTLSLSSNLFRGTLPDVFRSTCGRVPPLSNLVLSNNFFEGVLPPSFSELNTLTTLDLSNNSFSGMLAPHISGLRSLHYLVVSNNKFEGSLPDIFCSTKQALTRINLGSNRFEGTLPASLGRCWKYLHDIDFSCNRFNGTIPAAWDLLTALKSLDLSFNALSGAISSSNLFFLPILQTINLRSNKLSGLLPRFDSSLLLLDLDLSSNEFHGPLDLFGANSRPSINIVNVSNNFLTGLIQPKSVIVSSASINLLDISLNQFDCPYPLFRASVFMQRSPCTHPWTLYVTYLAYAIATAGIFGAAFVYFACVKRLVDAIRSSFAARPFILFLCSWCVACVSFSIDVRSCVEMHQHITQNVDNCAFVNGPAVYVSLMPPAFFLSFAEAAFSECSLNQTNWPSFACLVTDCLQPAFDPSPPAYSPRAIQAVASVCNGVRGCSFIDHPKYSCVLTHPELAEFGGIEFSRFLTCVIIALSLRLLVECSRGVCVAVSCWHRSTAWHSSVGDIISSSPLVVLLLVAMPREKFITEVAARDSTYHDLLRRLIHGVALCSLPILLVNVYFATHIAQTGLSPVTLLSTLLGAITIPVLVVRAVLVWRRQQQSLTTSVDPESSANREANVEMLELTEPTSTSGESNEIVHGSDTTDTPDNPYYSF